MNKYKTILFNLSNNDVIQNLIDFYFKRNLYQNKIKLKDFINEIEKLILIKALKLCNGNQKNASNLLKLRTNTLNSKIKDMDIKIEKKTYITNLITFNEDELNQTDNV